MRDIEERKMMRDIHSMAVSLDAISKELQKLNRRFDNASETLDKLADGAKNDEKSDFDAGYEKPLGTLR